MSHRDAEPTEPQPPVEQEKRESGPTGLTHREKQRRSIVIAGLSAPTMVSLPARRAWASGCTKSSLKKSSGALSAKGKQLNHYIGAIGCTADFWKNAASWPTMPAGGPQPGDDFESLFIPVSLDTRVVDVHPDSGARVFDTMYKEPVTLFEVLDKKGDISDNSVDEFGDDLEVWLPDDHGELKKKKLESIYKPLDGKLKEFNKAAVAAYLNAFYLNRPDWIKGFHIPGYQNFDSPPGTAPSSILDIYENTYLRPALPTGIDKDGKNTGANEYIIEVGTDFFEGQNNQCCPLLGEGNYLP